MLLYLFPIFFSIFASASSVDPIEKCYSYISILQTNCYYNIPNSIPLFEFDLSKTNPVVLDAMNVCNDDHLSLLEGALEDGVNFDVPCLPNQFPIHFAIEHERYEMFDLLVKKVDLNQRCILGLTPLHHALQTGNLYFIRELLKNGANPHKKALVECVNPPIMGRSFIEQSFYKAPMTEEFITFMMNNFVKYWRSNDEIIKKAIMAKNEPLLLEMVKRLPLVCGTRSLLEFYCDTIEFPSVREYLFSIDSKIYQKARNHVGGLSFYDASKYGNLLAVKIFVVIMRVDINSKSNDGWTALHYASSYGHKEIVEFLISKCSDISAKTDDGWTALHWASFSGHLKIVEILVNSNAFCIEDKDNNGHTALHCASKNGRKEVVEFLLNKGCDVNAKNSSGLTALHYASSCNRKEVVEFLVSKCCNVSAQDTYGMTALNYATENGYSEIVKFLKTRI